MVRPLTFLSDYGLDDDFVGVCHGVIARHRPGRTRHRPHPRHRRATTCAPARSCCAARCRTARRACTWPWSTRTSAPSGARSRSARPRTTGSSSAPTTACCRSPSQRFGGVVEAVDIGRSPHRLEPVSATFHGRDIFAPVAAALAAGARARRRRRPARPRRARRARACRSRRARTASSCAHAVSVDRFGNVMLDVEHDELDRRGLKLGQPVEVNGATAASTPRPSPTCPRASCCVYEDAYRTLALAVNRGVGARRCSALERDDELRIRPPLMLGTPRLHLRATDLDERPRARAGAGRRAARHARHRERADGRPRPPGPHVERAARRRAAALARAARPAARCCRSSPPSPSPTRAATRRADQVAQRRAARRPQGRRHPGRGPAAGGLGGAGHRRQRRRRRRPTCRPSCTPPPRRWAGRARPSSRSWPSCWPPSTRRWRSTPPRCWTAGARATRSRAGRSRGRRGPAWRAASTARGA